MISFSFKLNKSFLESKGHPITIPAQHLYRLRDEGIVSKTDKAGSKTTTTIVAPDKYKYSGIIQYDEAGGSFYYQILLPNEANSLYIALKSEEFVQVFVVLISHTPHVFLLDAKMSAQIKKFTDCSGAAAEARILEELEKMTSSWRTFV